VTSVERKCTILYVNVLSYIYLIYMYPNVATMMRTICFLRSFRKLVVS